MQSIHNHLAALPLQPHGLWVPGNVAIQPTLSSLRQSGQQVDIQGASGRLKYHRNNAVCPPPGTCPSTLPECRFPGRWTTPWLPRGWKLLLRNRYSARGRSEERRVGKECRSRGATGHEKKKSKK